MQVYRVKKKPVWQLLTLPCDELKISVATQVMHTRVFNIRTQLQPRAGGEAPNKK